MDGHGNDCVRMGVFQGIQHQVGVGAVATLVACEVLNQHTLDIGVKWLQSGDVVGLIDGFNDSFHGVVNAVAGDKSEHEGQRYKQGVNTMFHETNFGKKWRQGHKKIRVTEATRILVHSMQCVCLLLGDAHGGGLTSSVHVHQVDASFHA